MEAVPPSRKHREDPSPLIRALARLAGGRLDRRHIRSARYWPRRTAGNEDERLRTGEDQTKPLAPECGFFTTSLGFLDLQRAVV